MPAQTIASVYERLPEIMLLKKWLVWPPSYKRDACPGCEEEDPWEDAKKKRDKEIHDDWIFVSLGIGCVGISAALHAAFSCSMTSLVGSGFLTLVSACFSFEGSKVSMPSIICLCSFSDSMSSLEGSRTFSWVSVCFKEEALKLASSC
uniref:Putative conserved plasma membrane protein n=1 Tax=Rhipicephalus microplus TaxID=6941 RepID=A0A6G5AHL7_RHIMP